MCRGAGLRARIRVGDLPLLPGALDLAREGFVTGASRRNLESYGADVSFAPAIDDAARALLTDPQTSGGLLVACAREAVPDVLAIFREQHFTEACVVGDFGEGAPHIDVG